MSSLPSIVILVREPLTFDLTGLPAGPLKVMLRPSGDTVRRALLTLVPEGSAFSSRIPVTSATVSDDC